MRINIVTGPFYPVPPAPCGAVERLWNDLAREFAAQGHAVTVLCRHWPGQTKDETIDGVRYIRRMHLTHTRFIYWDLFQDWIYSARIFLAIPPADVTVTNAFWLPWLLRWRRRAGKVVVNVNRWPKGQMKLYRKSARLAAASTAIRDEVVRQCSECAPRVCVLPNPIDTEAFVPPAQGREAGSGIILYTGRIHPEKGVHVLVKAFGMIAGSGNHPNLSLRIIGPQSVASGGGGDPYMQSLRELSQGLNVEFLEPIYDRAALAKQLQAAEWFCYPSLAEHGESFGVAPLEAMATGLPTIVSGLAVFRDFLVAGENGLSFDHTSPDPAAALAEALRKLIEDPALARRLGDRAAQTAKRYSNQSVAAMCLEDFATLLSEKPA